ncbi:uncharacterized protein LOC127136621 [Lathyrus oleraceus]|uniref:uncharacterized protein LOC127136621 n=1 Tax=Pisum sativum TaxID=3888 RepID=UPI0021CE713D|nr:uncharacterized protein LOC127136621 [Pisum sativum]
MGARVSFLGGVCQDFFTRQPTRKIKIDVWLTINRIAIVKYATGLVGLVGSLQGLSKRRGKQNLNHGKPYIAPVNKGKQRNVNGKRPSEGGAPTPLKCYRCGLLGHRVSECKSNVKKCYKCEKSRHLVVDCKENMVTCYNYGEPGHINTHCPKPKKASIRGKVFALTGTQTSSDDRLIRGTCYINNIPLIVIIDTGDTHSFIVIDCVKRLGLVVSYMSGEVVIKTPAKGLETTTLVCLNCHLLIFDKDFSIDLICLPLENLDVILGMNWLEFNHVYINYYNKSVRFLTPSEEEEVGFLSTRELKELLEKEAQMFVLFMVLPSKSRAVIDELQVVWDFLKVFPYDILDVPLESDVEFSIDLVPGTKPIFMAPYRMFASELAELKKQLKDLLEKRFVKPNVSPWGSLVLL